MCDSAASADVVLASLVGLPRQIDDRQSLCHFGLVTAASFSVFSCTAQPLLPALKRKILCGHSLMLSVPAAFHFKSLSLMLGIKHQPTEECKFTAQAL